MKKTPSTQSVVVPVEPTFTPIDYLRLIAEGYEVIEATGSQMTIQSPDDEGPQELVIDVDALAAAPAPSSLAGGEALGRITQALVQADEEFGGMSAYRRRVLSEAILAALSPEAPALNTIGCAELEVGRAVYERIEKLIDTTTGPEAEELSYLAHLAASVEEVGGYDGPEAPAREGVFSAGQVWKDPHTDRWIADVEERGSAVVAAQAIGEDEDQAEARRDLILAALTPRHEAPASPTEREIDLLDAVMRAGGIVKTAAALPDKAAHLSVLTDALNRADAILTEGLNGAPVRHEAPAEGAGERECLAVVIDPSLAGTDFSGLFAEGSRIGKALAAADRVLALRARSSAPEAREGEAVAWRMRPNDGLTYDWAIVQSNPNKTAKVRADLYEVQPLYTHPAAPSADKLQDALKETWDALTALREAFASDGVYDGPKGKALRLSNAAIRSAASALRMGGA